MIRQGRLHTKAHAGALLAILVGGLASTSCYRHRYESVKRLYAIHYRRRAAKMRLPYRLQRLVHTFIIIKHQRSAREATSLALARHCAKCNGIDKIAGRAAPCRSEMASSVIHIDVMSGRSVCVNSARGQDYFIRKAIRAASSASKEAISTIFRSATLYCYQAGRSPIASTVFSRDF